MANKTRAERPAPDELDEVDLDGPGLTLTHQRVPDADGAWVLTMYWQEIDGRRECVGMKLVSVKTRGETDEPEPPGITELPDVGQVLTPGLVRDLKIGERIRADRAAFARIAETFAAVSRPPSLRQSTFERLETVARIYREAYAAGGKPTTAVAEHFGLTVGGASNLVSRARDIGLIPPTSRGASQG